MLNRDRLLIILGRLFTSYGYYLVIPFLIIYLTQYLKMSAMEAGILLGILNLSRRGFGILAGYWSDKFGAKKIMLIGLGFEVLSYLTLGWIKNFWFLIVIIFLSGLGGCLYNVSSRGILANTKQSQSTAVGFGLFYITMHIGALLGPLTYGWFAKNDLLPITFLVSAGFYSIFFIGTFIWLKNQKTSNTATIQFKDILGVFLNRPFMIYCLLITGAWFIVSQLYVFLPLQVLNEKNTSQLIAYLNSLNAILIIALQYGCSLLAGRMSTLDRFNLLAIGTLVMGIGWGFCMYQNTSNFYISMVVFTLGEILFISVVDLLAVTFAPEGQTGLYLGFATCTWAIGGAFASIVGSFTYSILKLHHHLTLFWLGILILSLLLSVGIFIYRDKILHTLELAPQV